MFVVFSANDTGKMVRINGRLGSTRNVLYKRRDSVHDIGP
jgi:hypothetical protein